MVRPATLKGIHTSCNLYGLGFFVWQHRLCFQLWDVSTDGKRLLPSAVETVRAAAEVLTAERGKDSSRPYGGTSLAVCTAMGDAVHLAPPTPAEQQQQELQQQQARGHAAWIRQLRPLNRQQLLLSGFVLQPADLLCLACTMDCTTVGVRGAWCIRG